MYQKKDKLTTNFGAPIADNQNSRTAGPRGPILLEDINLVDKLANFNREVIPERRMHAKGAGAYGTFTVTGDITRYTCADLFNKIGKVTEVFVRFSTVAGFRGAADAERDIRGFAVKFYTNEGNWDLVGNNTPVFFIRDANHFPDLNHVVKKSPASGLHDAAANWDFWTSLPEALHQITITMSDDGIPASYRNMHGFGSHTYSFYTEELKRTWVKFHWICQQEIKFLTDEEAARICGIDRDSNIRDLYEAIQRGDYPRWQLCVQLMGESEAQKLSFNPFDLTKEWPTAYFPLHEVGMLELNRNYENYFAEVEQSAFNPANIVHGIGFSPDKMLQARLFAYGDAQRYRLGVNHHLIPVNRARNHVNGYSRDGFMRTDGNSGSKLGYEPNSYGIWQEQKEFAVPATTVEGAGNNYDFRQDDDDYYTQPGNRFRKMDKAQRERLFANTARAMQGVPDFIKKRHIENCAKADPEYGRGVAAALGMEWSS
ncbi:MAG: catalase [Lentisphaerae bacterium]|nr:catalase [Lentisphaerota bacterium]